LRSDAEWGFMTEAEEAFIRRLRAAVVEAVSERWRVRLVLKSGEMLEGIPESINVNVANRPSSSNSPLAVEEWGHVGPAEVVIELAGTPVLSQEVEDFEIPQATDPANYA
jgi:hypothetical protein